MKKVITLLLTCALVIGMMAVGTSVSAAPAASETLARPSANGALAVQGTQLVDSYGDPVQLRGISTHGLAWYPEYVNQACFNEIAGWGANVVRLAMYTEDYHGYCTDGDQTWLKDLIRQGVQYATRADMYVIIDWHILSDGNPTKYQSQAESFFREMSAEFSGYNNVIYEICNEPNSGTSWSTIKGYANDIIPIICANDSDAIIVVGTPTWSQDVDTAAADPITGYSNIMYSLHFYAATHKDDIRNKMTTAYNAGLPIFCTEFGICDSSGSGSIDTASANTWIDLMNQYGISYVAWNLSNKDETSAIIKSSVTKTSGFTYDDLSASGQWLYNMLTAAKDGAVAAPGYTEDIVYTTYDGVTAWWYTRDGEVRTDYTGLAQNAYGWWYMENGRCYFNYTGLVQNAYGWWYIEDSHCTFSWAGLTQNENGWWYIEDSRCSFNWTGLTQNEYGWWYIEDSRCNFNWTGLTQNEYGWWYIEDSHCDFNYTGPVENEYGWWYIENSHCNFSYNGTVDGHTFVNSHAV